VRRKLRSCPEWSIGGIRDSTTARRTEHQPTRVREGVMRRFKRAGHAQRFLSAFGIISSHFRPRCHLLTAERYREEMELRFETWSEVSCVGMAA